MVYYGPNGLNVDSYGLDSATFLEMHEALVSLGLQVRQPWPKTQIRFVLYCHALIGLGADLSTLIGEYNSAQCGDGTDTIHALSLAKLYYHYHAAGHEVLVCRTDRRKTQPDLVIDEVNCELKVRVDQTAQRMEKYQHLLWEGREEEYHELSSREIRSHDEDLSRAILVAQEGFRQGDCVFLDLSSHFHSWNYHRLASGLRAGRIQGLTDRPVPAIRGTCVLFSPDNAINRAERGFHPRAFWGYLPVSS